MSLLSCPPAELSRGLCLDLDLSRPGDIAAQRGVVTGALTWDLQKGARFDGTNDFVIFTGQPVQLASTGFVSMVLEFWPDFAVTEAQHRYILDDDGGVYRNTVRKASYGDLEFSMGGANVLLVAQAAYQAYWKVGQRNVLVFTTVWNGNATAWLNGTSIGTSATGWSKGTGSGLVIGGRGASIHDLRYAGYIKSLKYFRHNAAAELITAQEASDFYNNRSYNYLSRSSCCLPMGIEQHEPSHATQSTDIDQTQVCADADMEAIGMAAWTTFGAGGTFQKVPGTRPGGTGARVMQIIRAGVMAYAYQAILTVGTRYRVTGWARGDGIAAWPRVGTGASPYWSGTTSATWQYCDVTFTASNANFTLYNHVADGTVEFDDFAVRQSPNVLSDGDSESSNLDAWSAGNNATLTQSLINPQQGLKCLQVAYSINPNPYAWQLILTVGKRYRATGWARGDGVYVPSVLDGAVVLWTGTSSTTWQSFSVDFTATTTGIRFQSSAVAAGNCCFDNLSLVEFRSRTLDASGRGNNFLLGDGCTVTTLPTKLGARGYSLDGGSDYLRKVGGLGLTDFTVVTVAKKDTGVAGCLWAMQRTGGTGTGLGAYITTDLTVITVLYNDGGSTVTTTAPFPRSAANHHAFVYTAATRIMQIYYNGALVYTTAALTVPNSYNGDFWLGVRCSDAVWYWPGSIYGVNVLPFCATPLQVDDQYHQVLQQIGAV
jgi:hypothetical protein